MALKFLVVYKGTVTKPENQYRIEEILTKVRTRFSFEPPDCLHEERADRWVFKIPPSVRVDLPCRMRFTEVGGEECLTADIEKSLGVWAKACNVSNKS